MAKRKLRPQSQLFLFADKFDKHLEDWFAGNLIFEYDLIPNNPQPFFEDDDEDENEKEILILNSLVTHFDKQYKKARLILNYNEQGLLLYQLHSTNSHAYKLETNADYKNLERINNLFLFYKALRETNNNYQFQSASIQKYIKPSLSKADFSNLKNLSTVCASSHSVYVDEVEQQLEQAFISHFCVALH